MKVIIHSIACPRIEVDFVEHWIQHHLNLGISKLYIYNLGVDLFYDSKPESIKKGDNVERVAAKRKHMDVDTRTTAEIETLWNSILAKYPDVIETKPNLSSYTRNRGSYDTIQRILNTSENEKYIKAGVDWMVNTDIDEYLCGDLKFLESLPKDTAHVQLSQKVYADRWDDKGYPREFSLDETPLTDKMLTICQKNIVRPLALQSWRNIHYDVILFPGYNKIWGEENIYFKHFRGAGYKDTAK